MIVPRRDRQSMCPVICQPPVLQHIPSTYIARYLRDYKLEG